MWCKLAVLDEEVSGRDEWEGSIDEKRGGKRKGREEKKRARNRQGLQ